MFMKILITGGSGMIGSALTKLLLEKSHEVVHLSRTASPSSEIPTYTWDPLRGHLEENALEGVQAIIHLAGAGIADERWTERRKKLIIDSRVESANLLHREVKKRNVALRAFISAGGINYYGMNTSHKIYTESDPPSDDFIGRCCVLWEKAADWFNDIARVVIFRTGVVLSSKGGALEKIRKPISMGIGAPLGSGDQWIPYIHVDDLCKMYLYAIENDTLTGVYNAVNGDHITNRDLTRGVAHVLNKKLWLPNVPSFVLKLVFGEMAGLVLEGSRASSQKIQMEGFSFEFENLERSLRDLYG